jgi:heme exporter protein D
MTEPRYPDAGNLPPTQAEVKAETNSLGDLLSEVSRDISVLMRQELELAKAEAKESATRAGKGAGMLAGAGIAAHFVLLFLSIALWWGLGLALGEGSGYVWSAIIVAVIWAIIAAILAAVGKKQMKSVQGLPRTQESVKKIPETLKPSEEAR